MLFTEISIQTGSVKFAILEARKISKACKVAEGQVQPAWT